MRNEKGQFVKGLHSHPETEFKKGRLGFVGPANPEWKGDLAGYTALHFWVERQLGKPSLCVECGSTSAKRYDWANISGEYKRDTSDWIRLCVSCHHKKDNVSYKLWESRRRNHTDKKINGTYKLRISEVIE